MKVVKYELKVKEERKEMKEHSPSTLLGVWPRTQRCAVCGAERWMHGIFPVTEWQLLDGTTVGENCVGQGEDPAPAIISDFEIEGRK